MSFYLDYIILGAVLGLISFGLNWYHNLNRQRRAKKGGCQ